MIFFLCVLVISDHFDCLSKKFKDIITSHAITLAGVETVIISTKKRNKFLTMWSFFSRDSSKEFPFEIGEYVAGLDAKSVWSLHKGKRKTTNEEVSIFTYDIKNGSDIKLEIAKSAMKRLKTLRHPSILQYLDSAETDKMLCVATECVQPLGTYLENLDKKSSQNDLYLAWGIFQITVSGDFKLKKE